MDLEIFDSLLRKKLPVGSVLKNLKSGTSTVVKHGQAKIYYRGRKVVLNVRIAALFVAYQHFSGKDVTTSDLKRFDPKVYNSDFNGHSCHCMFFLLAMKEMGIVNGIWGDGVRGSPFGVTMPSI